MRIWGLNTSPKFTQAVANRASIQTQASAIRACPMKHYGRLSFHSGFLHQILAQKPKQFINGSFGQAWKRKGPGRKMRVTALGSGQWNPLADSVGTLWVVSTIVSSTFQRCDETVVGGECWGHRALSSVLLLRVLPMMRVSRSDFFFQSWSSSSFSWWLRAHGEN